MILKNKDGRTIFESDDLVLRRTIEMAASAGISLQGGQFRRARLRRGAFDTIMAPHACFWGSDLTGSDMADADLRNADFRNSVVEDVCFAHADLKNADFRGAFLKNVILEGADIAGALFSGPGIFSCNLAGVTNAGQAFYVHDDGRVIRFGRMPLIVTGFSRKFVLMTGHILWGDILLTPKDDIPQELADFGRILCSMTSGENSKSIKTLSLSAKKTKKGLNGS